MYPHELRQHLSYITCKTDYWGYFCRYMTVEVLYMGLVNK